MVVSRASDYRELMDIDTATHADSDPLRESTFAPSRGIETAGALREHLKHFPADVNLASDERPEHPRRLLTGEWGRAATRREEFPFSYELLQALPPDEPLLAPKFSELTHAWTAGLQSPEVLRSFARTLGKVFLLSAAPERAEQLLPLPADWKDNMLVRRFRSLEALQKFRWPGPDLIFVDPVLAEQIDVQRWMKRHSNVQSRTLDKASDRSMFAYVEALRAVDRCFAQLDPRQGLHLQDQGVSVIQRFRILNQRLLEGYFSAPLMTRWILMTIDRQVLPLLGGAGFGLASAFPTADEALVYPLLFFHRDVARLRQEGLALAVSPKAAISHYGANALHMRFFSSYDTPDVLMSADLLDIVLPYLERELASPAAQDSLNGPIVSDRSDLRPYIRGLLNGLVMLADYDAFVDIFAQHGSVFADAKHSSPRRLFPLSPAILKSFETTSAAFRERLSAQAERLISVLQVAKCFYPEEFTDSIPRWFEYFYGYYGSDELEAIIAFNATRPPENRISFFEVMTGSDREDVREYCTLHRGRKPLGREERKRSQFSRDAVAHALWGRSVWRRVVALVNQTTPALDDLIAVRPAANLSKAVDIFSRHAASLPPGADQRRLLSFVVEYCTRIPPPAFPIGDFRAFVHEGESLASAVSHFVDEFEASSPSGERRRSIRFAQRALERYCRRARIALNAKLSSET